MHRLEPGTRCLGRSSENDLQLPEMSVSRAHAQLRVDPEGPVQLTDLGSTNGTFLNGRRLRPHQPTSIEDGDRISFGPSMIVKFSCPDPCEEDYQRQLFERAVRDPLTGLYNRGYFLERAPILDRQADAQGLGLAILLIDIDHFKKVNDTLGHDAGDAVLRVVAQTIRKSTRADDLIARYGGEEFIAAIPVATSEQAIERAEQIRQRLAQQQLHASGRTFQVTASVGLTLSRAGQEASISSMITAADNGLYEAKRKGRNRVAFRSEIKPPVDPLTTTDYVVEDNAFLLSVGSD